MGSKSVDTKDEILKAASRLFANNGFDGVSMREISNEAGTSLNSIRYHFGSKDDLLANLLQQLCKSVYETPIRILETGAKTKEEFGLKLGLFLNEVLVQMISRKEIIKIAINDGHRVEGNHDYVPQQSKIIEYIKNAQAKKIVSPEIAPEMIGGVFMDRLLPQVLHADHLEKVFGTNISNPTYRKEWVDATLNLFLNGLYSRS